MTRKFQNPSNGYTEEIGTINSVAMLLLGVPYLMLKGLWKHVFIFFGVMLFAGVSGGGAAGAFAACVVATILYALSIQGILATSYLQKGWVELHE